MKIGVLALQGAVAEHMRMLEQAGAEAIAIKQVEALADVDGIILPGGESTTIGKLMRTYGFIEALRQFSAQGKAIFGTCAGMILLANDIQGQEDTHLALMDISVTRNAFGRQRESFEVELPIEGFAQSIHAVFIRAPLIERVGANVRTLCTYKGHVVAARQDHLLVSSFHPELTNDCSFHRYFVEMVR